MEIISLIIWSSAATLYLAFLAWHENWRGPLSESEISHFMKLIEANSDIDEGKKEIFLKFMRKDTGREFFMLNLLAFPKGKIKHPESGDETTGNELLQSYFRPFAGMILRNAGYPAYNGLVRSDYVENWGVETNPGWRVAGLMRYRSRRDIMRAVTNPAFAGIHIYKRTALAATLAVPVETLSSSLFSPRLWLALILIALAALGHLAVLLI